jgi:hypothetical protein
MKKVGVLMYTYNRTDDVKINMEIIRNVWQKEECFKDIEIVHAYNGKKEWYVDKYLENKLVRIKNTWHFQGASDLIDAGIKKFQDNVDYVVVLAADTWIIKPEYVKNLLEGMESEKLYLATCSWGISKNNSLKDVGMAVDFFIINLRWAKKFGMFPVNYGKFHKKYEDLFLYQNGGNVMLEKLMLASYIKTVGREENFGGSARKKAFKKILFIKDREPVHECIDEKGDWIRKMYWEKIGLLTHHEPISKRKILKENKIKGGDNVKKLLESNDLSYFNKGITKTKYSSN